MSSIEAKMKSDGDLLRQYVDEGSDLAFSELVERHVDLVFSAALRRTRGDSHAACDVSQVVFTRLAREARRLNGHPALAAWLHAATRNAALNLMISEQRRKRREGVAAALFGAEEPGPGVEWAQLRPVLDGAVDKLSDADRAVVVLRYFQRRTFADIGRVLAVSEDAARMRAERALEKLRMRLARRGITSTAAALGCVISTHGVTAAPVGLSAGLAAAALSASVSVAGAAAGVVTLMSIKTVAIAASVVTVAFFAGSYLSGGIEISVVPSLADSRVIAMLRAENGRLASEVERLRTEDTTVAAARPLPTAIPGVVLRPSHATPELTRAAQQRALLNNLRTISGAIDQFFLEQGRSPMSLDELLGPAPKIIRSLTPVDGEDYTRLALLQGQPLTITTARGVTVTFGKPDQTTKIVGAEEEIVAVAQQLKLDPEPLQKAYNAYLATHRGQEPRSVKALLAYFANPQEAADFSEALEAQNSRP